MSKKMEQSIDQVSGMQWSYSFLTSEQFVSFMDLIPDAAILSDTSGKIILTNIAAQELFEYTREEFLQCVIEDLVPEPIRRIHPKMRAYFFENPEPRLMGNRGVELSACKKMERNFRWSQHYLS